MKLARKIDRGVLVVVAVVLALPAFARANPLLSGYGGPGQGSQALLGSTLTGGHGAGGVASEGAPPERVLEQPATSATSAQPDAASTYTSTKHSSSRRHTGSAPAGGGSGNGGGPGGGEKLAFVPRGSAHTDAAGLTGGDFALIAAALAVILATGVSMSRLRPKGGGT